MVQLDQVKGQMPELKTMLQEAGCLLYTSPDAVKIGMISSAELVTVIAETLRKYKAENVVLDPVMVATSGSRLMKDETVEVMRRQLIPAADIITPNIPEAQVLTGIEIKCPGDMERAAELLAEQYGCAVLCKGGHSVSDADDVLSLIHI